jgi:hypothetical protein
VSSNASKFNNRETHTFFARIHIRQNGKTLPSLHLGTDLPLDPLLVLQFIQVHARPRAVSPPAFAILQANWPLVAPPRYAAAPL